MGKLIKTMLCSILLAASAQLFAQDVTIDVDFPTIKKDSIVLSGGREYRITSETKCFTEGDKPVSYQSIYDVGHIDKARITLGTGVVKTIRILDIQM